MQNKPVRIGPIAIPGSVGNLLNPGTTAGGVNAGCTGSTPAGNANTYLLIRHLRIVNKTGGAVAFNLYIGATGASAPGTEFMGAGSIVPANGSADFYGALRLDVGDFLTGSAGATASLVLEGEGEMGIA